MPPGTLNRYEAAILPSELPDFNLPAPQKSVADQWSRLSFDVLTRTVEIYLCTRMHEMSV